MRWYLLHLFMIFCVFGLGVAWREVIVAWRSLERWFVYGSEDPESFKKAQDPTVVHHADPAPDTPNPFTAMQAKADTNKLAALKSAMKSK